MTEMALKEELRKVTEMKKKLKNTFTEKDKNDDWDSTYIYMKPVSDKIAYLWKLEEREIYLKERIRSHSRVPDPSGALEGEVIPKIPLRGECEMTTTTFAFFYPRKEEYTSFRKAAKAAFLSYLNRDPDIGYPENEVYILEEGDRYPVRVHYKMVYEVWKDHFFEWSGLSLDEDDGDWIILTYSRTRQKFETYPYQIFKKKTISERKKVFDQMYKQFVELLDMDGGDEIPIAILQSPSSGDEIKFGLEVADRVYPEF